MAETVEFRSNGNMASGYLATPASGKGPGVLVIQEWWGLDSGIKENADRLAPPGSWRWRRTSITASWRRTTRWTRRRT